MIRYLLSFILVTAIYADISEEMAAAGEQASMDGLRGVQYAVDDGEALMDAFPPRSCFAEWWALERAGLSMLAASLRAHVMGAVEESQALLNAAAASHYQAGRTEVEC